jgi:hypothetical protein
MIPILHFLLLFLLVYDLFSLTSLSYVLSELKFDSSLKVFVYFALIYL